MIIYCVGLISVLIALAGLCLDVGMMEVKRVRLQNATDAFVIGAELEWERGSYTTFAQNGNAVYLAAAADAATNGIVAGQNGATITVVYPSTTGLYANRWDAGMAILTVPAKSIFIPSTITLKASATILFQPCVYIMGGISGALNELSVTSGSQFNAACPIYVNGTFSDDSTSGVLSIVTNVVQSSGTVNGNVSPAPHYNTEVHADPLAYVTSPVLGACSAANTNVKITTTTTIQPGSYCGGITITNATVTFSPGLYAISGGITWSGATVTGTGVTLFLTTQSGASVGACSISGSSNVKLSAPLNNWLGAVPGITIFGDRNQAAICPSFVVQSSTIQGDGIWYMINSGLSATSSRLSGNNYFGVVLNSLTSKSSTVTAMTNFTVLPGRNPFHPSGGLVE